MKLIQYFGYASNLHTPTFLARIQDQVYGQEVVKLSGYTLTFDGKNSAGQARANIQIDPNAHTYGILYTISEEVLDKLEKTEPGYKLINVTVVTDSGTQTTQTFISPAHAQLPLDKEYLDLMLSGARENGLPETYINHIQKRGFPILGH
ncbi:gamma-glutamylcyclotransferase family protein [Penaeicola halotolerans]|uniref:gamma-glutamylcyclotransferase family protein n=1 Tax=Penaeicola halotolerans TaxID=2793196 RepID=UPI001CF8C696|nr:gamma-glutamylcyclotransferase family protein [Penaeicola halotolerans]